MSVEIEAKLKVDSLEKVAERLSGAGAEFVQEQRQTDSYFDDAAGRLKSGDRALRVRRQVNEQSETIVLCYKGPKALDDFKKREETEFEIADGELAEQLLGGVGYKKVLTFEKRRRVWRLGGCGVMLDELPLLGSFVEIEGPDDGKIADVQKELGLGNLRHIQDSYASLMDAKLRELGRDDRDVSF